MPRGKKRRTAEQCEMDFWSRVKIKGKRDCWNWTGHLNPGGYGLFCKWRKTIGAHREAYLLKHGEIPNGLQVLHHCDNRRCCNADHLFLGTAADNVHDCVMKCRHARGEKHSAAKISTKEVREIRKIYMANVKPSGRVRKGSDFGIVKLARKFNVSKSLIHYIVTGKSWSHVPMPV